MLSGRIVPLLSSLSLTPSRDFLWFDEGGGLLLVEPVGEVLFKQWCLTSLTNTRDIGPVGIALLLDEVLRR